MNNTAVRGSGRPGLAKKPYSAGLGLVALISLVIPVLSARLLAFDLLGYHVPDRPPHPEIWGLVLVLGLSLAIVGQLLGAGRNEGIRSRGWVGVMDVLFMRLAFAGLAFMGSVLQYAIRGKQIPLYPVGLLTILSGFFFVSRVIAKYIFHVDRRRRGKTLSDSAFPAN